MLDNVGSILRQFFPRRQPVAAQERVSIQEPLTALGLTEFLSLEIPPREMLLDPILPERSLAMLYAPRVSHVFAIFVISRQFFRKVFFLVNQSPYEPNYTESG